MDISSEKIKLAYDAKTSYAFLSQPENYKSLMPESVERFELNEDGGFLFQLKGMPAISLILEEESPHDKIVWGSASDKFKFRLWAEITSLSDEGSEAQFLFHGDLNPMITMMAKRPLGKFIETLSSNLASAQL